MRIPGKTKISANAHAPPGLDDFFGTLYAAIEGFLMAVEDLLSHAIASPQFQRGLFKIKGGNNGCVSYEEKFNSLIVHKGGVFDGVITRTQSVFDPLVCPAMTRHLEPMVVGHGDHGVHFFKGHAKGVVIIGVWRGGIARGIGLDPFHTILHQFSNGGASLIWSIDQKD